MVGEEGGQADGADAPGSRFLMGFSKTRA